MKILVKYAKTFTLNVLNYLENCYEKYRVEYYLDDFHLIRTIR